jgi:hypothetical protein
MNLFGRTFFVFLLVLGGLNNANSQTPKNQKKGKEPSPIGWGVNIGNIRFYNNAFEFGLAPNIAYRLGETLSVGFMMKLDYYYQRYPAYDLKFSAFDFGPTVFTRWKPLFKMDGATPFMQGLFLQAEYERAFIAREAVDEFGNLILNDKGTRIETVRNGEDYLYVGLGAASGYPFSTFVSIHYNVLDNSELSRIPFNYRIGLTWNY